MPFLYINLHVVVITIANIITILIFIIIRFRDTRDFAVVLQPFLANQGLPRNSHGMLDNSYFSPDCFHLSAKGQAAMAVGLWNNMLQPVGEKSTT